MLSVETLEEVLEEYVERVVPAMQQWNYHLLLAKGGPEYPHLPEQSLFTHVINGVFGLARFVRFLSEQGVFIPGLDEETLRKALVLFSVHEVHKLPDVERMESSEFAIPLERLRKEYNQLGLRTFADVDEHLMRAANVHKRSPRHGDLLQTLEADAPLLYILVRVADALASIKTLDEASSSLMGWLKRLGPEFAPRAGRFAFYWHQLRDVRGVLTNTVHQVVASRLQEAYSFYPLLFFATGTLYIGPRMEGEFNREAFITQVVDDVLEALTQQGEQAKSQAQEGLRPQKFDFQPYVYAFASVPTLLEIVHEKTLLAEPDVRVAEKELTGLAAKRKDLPADWLDTVEARFGISRDEPEAFNKHWSRVRRYLLYVDTLLRDLNPGEDRLAWFLEHFPVPPEVAANLQAEQPIWARGGVGKYVLIVAYHFLRGPAFAAQPAETQPADKVLERLHRHVLEAFTRVDTLAGRQAVLADLGFRPDLTAYLAENLHFSWEASPTFDQDPLTAYVQPKRKGHRNELCSLCNRASLYVQELRTDTLGDFGRVFSNRVLPAQEAPGKNRPWCPICHLEFIFRKLAGVGLPSGADYGNTRRIYLYVLPTFSFTPEHTRLFRNWLRGFHQQVTALPVRDYGTALGVPHRWLKHRELDPTWLEEVRDVLVEQAERIAQAGGLGYVGERLAAGRVRGQPHYYLIVWEKAARRQEQDDARIATRTEAWAKALFAATVISAITGCKVYVTERPYLPVTDPADLKATVVLDSPPPALRALTPAGSDGITLYGRERGERSGLEQALDLTTALWVATEHIQRHLDFRNQKDKRIAEQLALVNTSPLAGATFYKTYARFNDGRTPEEVFTRACEVLLILKGGELMNLVERLAEKALEIALPFRTTGRGKPRRYELVFRDTVDAMRKAFDVIPELRQTALLSRPPSPEAIAELKSLTAGTVLKGLERRREQRRGEIMVRSWGEELSRRVSEFVDLVVDEVYLGRAGGSFARFLRLENSIADGIFYYTDRVLSDKWDEYNREKAARQVATQSKQEV